MDTAICLPSLSSLSTVTVLALALHPGTIIIDFVDEQDHCQLTGPVFRTGRLREAHAQALSVVHKGELVLINLDELSDSAARALGTHGGRLLINLKLLPESAVSILLQMRDDLDPSSCGRLADETIEVIARRNTELDLRSLYSLSDVAAQALASHKGDLDLRGLDHLSDEAAHALSKHQGRIRLAADISLSDRAVCALDRSQGTISFI